MTKEAFEKAVIARINGDREHGWGVDDSMAVIGAVFEDETGEKMDAETVGKWIRLVVNPSAFRQTIEGEDGKGLLNKHESRKQRKEALFAEFNK